MIHNAVVGGSNKFFGTESEGYNLGGTALSKNSFIGYYTPSVPMRISLGIDKAMSSYNAYEEVGDDLVLHCYKDSDAKYKLALYRKRTLERSTPVIIANGYSTTYTAQMALFKISDTRFIVFTLDYSSGNGNQVCALFDVSINTDTLDISVTRSNTLEYSWFPLEPGDFRHLYDSTNGKILFCSYWGSSIPSGYYNKYILFSIDVNELTMEMTIIGNSSRYHNNGFLYTKEIGRASCRERV